MVPDEISLHAGEEGAAGQCDALVRGMVAGLKPDIRGRERERPVLLDMHICCAGSVGRVEACEVFRLDACVRVHGGVDVEVEGAV